MIQSREHPMELSLMFHENGPIVSSGQCMVEETIRNLAKESPTGKTIPKLIFEVNDLRIVGPLMKLLIAYPAIANKTTIKTRSADVSRNVKTINLERRLHVNVIVQCRPRF